MTNEPSAIERLPPELLDAIFDVLAIPLRQRMPNDPLHKTARGWLARCQATSRTFRARALPQLFRQITISIGMSYPKRHMDAFVELCKDANAKETTVGSAAVCEIREFAFYQVEYSNFFMGPVRKVEEDVIGKMIRMLLDLAKAGKGQLQSVAVTLNPGEDDARCLKAWADLGGGLKRALEECCSLDSPVKNLWLRGMLKIPLSFLASSQLTKLSLKMATVEHSGSYTAPALAPPSGLRSKTTKSTVAINTGCPPVLVRSLTIVGVGSDDELPLDLSLIHRLGDQLGTLEVWIRSSPRSLNPLSKFNQVGSLPSNLSIVTPAFPNLSRLRVGVYLSNNDSRLMGAPQHDLDLEGYLTFKDFRWVELIKQFLITLPTKHTPLLEQVDIVFRPVLSQSVLAMKGEPPTWTTTHGWHKRQWEETDERILRFLSTRTQLPGALPLRIRILVRYVFNYLHRPGDIKPPHLGTPKSMWTRKGYPRVKLFKLLPRTMRSFRDCVSLHEDFAITYTFGAY